MSIQVIARGGSSTVDRDYGITRMILDLDCLDYRDGFRGGIALMARSMLLLTIAVIVVIAVLYS